MHIMLAVSGHEHDEGEGDMSQMQPKAWSSFQITLRCLSVEEVEMSLSLLPRSEVYIYGYLDQNLLIKKKQSHRHR